MGHDQSRGDRRDGGRVSGSQVDPRAVLSELKDFQRRTAIRAFERLFDPAEPTQRFLVADEVGLGKTHVAKGVVAQVIDHLHRSGDQRHDIVYVCSNGAIARQNLRKLVPAGIEPLDDVERLTMLSLAKLNQGTSDSSGVNLLAITPGTSLKFGHSTGRFQERCLAYTYLRAHWGADLMIPRARWIFWEGVSRDDGDRRLRDHERRYRRRVLGALPDFARELKETDRVRVARNQAPLRKLFDDLVHDLTRKRSFPEELRKRRSELISEVRRIMAIVGISALRPDLVILDEFQRFKDLLEPRPENFAAELAHRLFDYVDPETERPTKTLLLSATPYRMYTTADESDADHYADFVSTCSFLFSHDEHRVKRLEGRFRALRGALTAPDGLPQAEEICGQIGPELRQVIARTERLSATPDRDGMLHEVDVDVSVEETDLRSYVRIGNLSEAVGYQEPTAYWKSAPYLVNFMENYQFKRRIRTAIDDGALPPGELMEPGPGLLRWEEVENYEGIDPQNGRLRWLLDDLRRRRAFELLWMPPSLRYYDTGSVYESTEAADLTKRLIFSEWAVVPKVVSTLVSFEAERHAYAARGHAYTADHSKRGGRRLMFRTTDRGRTATRPGESTGGRRAAAMTSFLLVWPSATLAELGDPRPGNGNGVSTAVADLHRSVEKRVIRALEPLVAAANSTEIDPRWYWAAPLLLDAATRDFLLEREAESVWGPDTAGVGFGAHLREAQAMIEAGPAALGRPPEDLVGLLARMAIGGPAQCALRSISAIAGLGLAHEACVQNAAFVAAAFRNFFNAPEVTGVVTRGAGGTSGSDGPADESYWREVVTHCVEGNLQAVLDEHLHVLRDWLGFVELGDELHRVEAADEISLTLAEALNVRTSVFRVDIPRPTAGGRVKVDQPRMRTRLAVAFGKQSLDEGGEARLDAVITAFNSPFWPFVLASTSVGQEGLDFHLWCHAVVHWNLPSNPVDLEQREGRVHRYKGHAVRRNVAAAVGRSALSSLEPGTDPWEGMFSAAGQQSQLTDSEMVPYWVFPEGPAKIERYVPILPFSRETVSLPRLRKTLAAYRLAFGQPRQEELVEFLGAGRTEEELVELADRLRIDLSTPG